MNALKILNYSALIFGFQTSAFFLFFLIAEGGAYLIEGKTSVIPIMVLMIFTVGGYVWAISNPGKGSLVMISGGIFMAIYLIILGGIVEIKMALIFSMPFIIPGLILYLTAKRQTILKQI